MKKLIVLMAFWVASLVAHAGPIIVYTDAPSGTGGDLLDRGFYISNYTAGNLSTVTLYYLSNTGGSFTASLTANLNTYNGPSVGSTQQATFNVAGGLSSDTAVVFDFGGAAVPTGSIITFTQSQISGSDLFFDTGTAGPTGVTETEGTTPPLDTSRRGQVATTITANEAAAAPEPSSIILLGWGLIGLGGLRRIRRS